MMNDAASRLSAAIRQPKRPGQPALMPYVTSGYPSREGFGDLLRAVGAVADVIEVGVPFSDPMADGLTIQRSSHAALKAGVTLPWILETLAALDPRPAAPMVLMSYFNPLLSYGIEALVRDAAAAGVSGFIVPDLPWEEGAAFREAVASAGLAAIQLVTPLTPPERLARITAGTTGFVYAVTLTGTTGTQSLPEEASAMLDRVRDVAPVPVCAGFGIRTAADVARLRGHADGVVVGSALIDVLAKGGDPVGFLEGLFG